MLVRVGRRHFLQGAGGALLAVPFLRSLTRSGDARGAVASPLKRIIVIAQPHGAQQWHRNPDFSRAQYGVGDPSFLVADAASRMRHGVLPSDPAAIAKGFDIALLRGAGNPVREQMCVFNGMMAPGDNVHGHVDRTKCSLALSGNIHFGEKSISIDQVLHEKVYGARVPDRRSIYMGSRDALFFIDKNGSEIACEKSPREAYRNFVKAAAASKAGASPGNTATAAPTPSGASDSDVYEESILNSLSEERRILAGRKDLSRADKDLLTAYFDHMNDLEARVQQRKGMAAGGSTPPPASMNFSCTAPSESSVPDRRQIPQQGNKPAGQDDVNANVEAYGLVAKLAFMCDITRVVGINLGGWATLSRGSYQNLGIHAPSGEYDEHQTIWHPIGDGIRGGARPELHVVCSDHVGMAAQIASELHAVKTDDGAGTLLDDTLIVYATEFGAVSPTWDDGHGHTDMCYVTFGGKNALNTGRYYDSLNAGRRPVGSSAWTVNNFLQTILAGFNLQASDWESLQGGRAGFGRFSSTTHKQEYTNNSITVMGASDSEKRMLLPGVLKGVI